MERAVVAEKKEPLCDVVELLEALYSRYEREVGELVYFFNRVDPCFVDQTHEGRHCTFSTTIIDVEHSTVKEAHERGYLIGRPEWGYRSTHRWHISCRGKEYLRDIRTAHKCIGQAIASLGGSRG